MYTYIHTHICVLLEQPERSPYCVYTHIVVSALVGAAHKFLSSVNKSRHNFSAHTYTMRLAYFKKLNHNTITL